MSDSATIDDAMEVTLIGRRDVASGEVHLTFAVQRDDNMKTTVLVGKIGHPYRMWLGRINYEATEDLAPVTSADSNPMGAQTKEVFPQTVVSNGDKAPASALESPARGHFTKQAAIWIQKPYFRRFLAMGTRVPSIDEADEFVKNWCDVTSKKQIIPDTPAGKKWNKLMGLFDRYLKGEDVELNGAA